MNPQFIVPDDLYTAYDNYLNNKIQSLPKLQLLF